MIPTIWDCKSSPCFMFFNGFHSWWFVCGTPTCWSRKFSMPISMALPVSSCPRLLAWKLETINAWGAGQAAWRFDGPGNVNFSWFGQVRLPEGIYMYLKRNDCLVLSWCFTSLKSFYILDTCSMCFSHKRVHIWFLYTHFCLHMHMCVWCLCMQYIYIYVPLIASIFFMDRYIDR